MDYLLLYSEYSPSSKQLLAQFPALLDKAVCVDSAQMRTYVKHLKIVCVPTLLVLLQNKIVDRIFGGEAITQWLYVTLYRAQHLQGGGADEGLEPAVDDEMSTNEPVAPQQKTVSPPLTTGNQTSLDDLVLEDVEEGNDLPRNSGEPPVITQVQSGNTMQLAEVLKKERDNSDPVNKKKFPA